MVIRRGDVTDIVRLEMKCLITNGHVTALLIWFRHITAWCFSVVSPLKRYVLSIYAKMFLNP